MSEAGEGGAAAAELSRGRREEGRRRRLARGDTDAGSGRGGESQRLPSSGGEREPQPGRASEGTRAGSGGRGRGALREARARDGGDRGAPRTGSLQLLPRCHPPWQFLYPPPQPHAGAS